jgi:hypothetical protein
MTNKLALIVFGTSVGITIALSALFGFAGSSIVGTFWGWFWLSLLLQVIAFAIVNSFLLQRDAVNQQQAEIQTLAHLSKFSVKLNCAYCQQPAVVPIQLNEKNTFKCESCNQVSSVSMQFMATTLTTPLESVTIPIDDSSSAEFKVSS